MKYISFEQIAKSMVESHGCTFVHLSSTFRVEWLNSIGILRSTPMDVLSNMNDAAWEYFRNH